LLVNGHLGEIYCWPGEKDATGQRGQVQRALSKHVPVLILLVLAEGILAYAALKVPGPKQAVVSGPVSRAHCSILPPTLSCDAVLRGDDDLKDNPNCSHWDEALHNRWLNEIVVVTLNRSTEAVALSVLSINIPLRAWSTIVSKTNS